MVAASVVLCVYLLWDRYRERVLFVKAPNLIIVPHLQSLSGWHRTLKWALRNRGPQVKWSMASFLLDFPFLFIIKFAWRARATPYFSNYSTSWSEAQKPLNKGLKEKKTISWHCFFTFLHGGWISLSQNHFLNGQNSSTMRSYEVKELLFRISKSH